MPRSVSPLAISRSNPTQIKGIFAGHIDPATGDVVLQVQAFNKSRLLAKNLTILFTSNTYQRLADPGLTLDSKLAGVFRGGALCFRSYAAINPIIDISNYFTEASDKDIEQILQHDALLVDNIELIVTLTDSVIRKRYSAILASKVLDVVTPRKIVSKAKAYGFKLSTKKVQGKDALVFPTTKAEIKELLTFLNEGFYKGELTGELFRANSKRPIAKSGPVVASSAAPKDRKTKVR